MATGIFQQNYILTNESISIEYQTTGRLVPAHWHDHLEIIYLLNGSADVYIDGQVHHLVNGDFIVTDTGRIHEAHCTKSYMQIVIRISESLIQSLMGGRRDFRIICSRYDLTDETLPQYMEIRDLLRQLAPLYVRQTRGYMIKSQSLVLDVLYHLEEYFSVPLSPQSEPSVAGDSAVDNSALTNRAQLRAREILKYIDGHYAEPLSLDGIAGHFGLNSEYFSRMFHKTFGIPFVQHLNHVRLSHIHHDICTTDEPVLSITERHGFSNYKLFLKMFREVYGGTPRDIRRQARIG